MDPYGFKQLKNTFILFLNYLNTLKSYKIYNNFTIQTQQYIENFNKNVLFLLVHITFIIQQVTKSKKKGKKNPLIQPINCIIFINILFY